MIRLVDLLNGTLADYMGCSCKQTVKNVVNGITKDIPKAIVSGYASSDIIDKRRTICDGCPSNKHGVCIECSCVVTFKTTFNNVQCPLNKW